MSVRVEDPEPGAAIDPGLKPAVVPDGSPEAVKVIAELKPSKTAVVMVLVPLAPCATETDAGEAAMVNPVTVSATVAVCVTPPPVPVTVTV